MLPVAEPSYHRPTTRPSRRTHLHHFPTCRPSRSESKTLCHLALSSSAILLPNLPSCTDHDTYVCRERERKRRYYIRASHFTPISGRGRFCPTCAGPPPSVVRSTRPDFEHHLGLQLATSSCMVSRSTWTTRATKPRHLQLADLRRMRSIRPTALSIAASSGRRAARCCRSASNQSGHAAGRKTAIASAPLRATSVRFSHTHTKTPDGG